MNCLTHLIAILRIEQYVLVTRRYEAKRRGDQGACFQDRRRQVDKTQALCLTHRQPPEEAKVEVCKCLVRSSIRPLSTINFIFSDTFNDSSI
ncbi:hypothetical protein OH492_29075 [Vibrio chagasii]|nr:hypothetical protein [Vibrio chagasii]